MSLKSLSKSKFLNGLQCHKSLWLYKNRPDLKEDAGAGKQAIFDQGSSIGELAQGLFPAGEAIRFEEGSFEEKIESYYLATILARVKEYISALE